MQSVKSIPPETLETLQGCPGTPPQQPMFWEHAGIKAPINVGDVVGPAPDNLYIPPRKGLAARAFTRLALHFFAGSSIAIVGPAGNGKDAAVEYLCRMVRREYQHLPFNDGIDPMKYIAQRNIRVTGLNADGSSNTETVVTPGALTLAIQGRVGRDGIRRPVTCLLSDLDRASAESAEILRHLLQGDRLFVPDGYGDSFEVNAIEGSQEIATMNTNGEGDRTGLYRSAQTLDSTLIERFQVWIKWPFMEAVDERRILQQKFPLVWQQRKEEADKALEITTQIRKAITDEKMFTDWGHRTICHWFQSMDIRIQQKTWASRFLLRDALEDVTDRSSPEVRTSINRIVGLHVS